MHSKISDYLSSWCTDLISLLLLALHTVWKSPKTSNLTMTVPFKIGNPFRSSLRKARVLRQTELRRCWFDEASKNNKEVNTRLGTLRFLPYEIRQQIFKIVLEDYFDEYNLQGGEPSWPWRYAGDLTKWQLRYEGWCCCLKYPKDEMWDVFTLTSYCHIEQHKKRAPLNLRFASESLEQEFDQIFLASNTFEFTCPSSLERFMNVLSPLQQRQLKRIKLHMFGGHAYCICVPNNSELFKHWADICERLPPGLISVQFVLSYPDGRWRDYWTDNRLDRGFADIFGLMSKKWSRACPRAKISLIGSGKICKDDDDALNAMLKELEPWSKEYDEWMDRSP